VGAPTVVHGGQSQCDSVPTGPSGMAGWVALGFVGALGMVLTGSRIGSVPGPAGANWWFSIPLGGSPYVSVAFYVSVVLVVAGWLGVGRRAWRGRLTTGRAWIVLAVWALPFVVGPPLFSRDIYSYVGQGLIAHRGLDPYSTGPSVLGPGSLLSSIASVWRSTPSPYGPLFVGATRAVATVAGSSLVDQVLAFRALELVGVALVMVFLPRLARHLGTDPGVALWLGALSPLALFSFVASGHNDALMVGLLVAGVALAVEGRLFWGLVLCALAATVKLPAALAIVFLAVDRFRTEDGTRRWRVAFETVAATAAVFVGVTLAVGYGWTWIGPSALHVPTELRVLSTPSVSLGVLAFHLLHVVGVPVVRSSVVAVVQYVVALGAVLGTAWLLWTVRHHGVVRSLGLALILVVVGSPTVWPWYLMWGLVLLAATTAQRSRVLAAVAALSMLVVGPSGSPRLLGASYVAVCLVSAAACIWLVRDQRWRKVVTGHAS